MPVTKILKLESDISAKCYATKLKDNLWLEESKTLERVRVYLDVVEGEVSGFRLIMQSKSVKFLRDVSDIVKNPEEESFIRVDVPDKYVPAKVIGSSREYSKGQTEVVLRFLESKGKGRHIAIFDLETDKYEKSSRSTFLLTGEDWQYESRNFYEPIREEDEKYTIECGWIELWMVPPSLGVYWSVETDMDRSRYTRITNGDITTYQEKYHLSEAGPAGRLAFQWVRKGKFGTAAPSMVSNITCKFAVGPPLVFFFSLAGFAGLIISILALVM